jgi:probable phosphoglycerate mutase
VLLLVRHGESAANAAGVLVGRGESPLTDRGRGQVAALAGVLVRRPIALVLTSPLGRARETAEALGLGAPIEVDDRWIEVDYGDYEGRAPSSLPADLWRHWRADPFMRPPGGETLAEVGLRVRAACDELFSSAGSGARGEFDVVVVSHVSPIKAAVAWALGAPDDLTWHLRLSTASLTRLTWGADEPVLLGYNEVPAG